MGFDRLTDILKKIQSRYPLLSKRIQEADAVARWESAVGPLIAKHALAIRVHEGILWVEVSHPIWRSELHHRKRQILQVLNSSAGGGVLKDIYFVDPRGRGAGTAWSSQPKLPKF